MIFVYKWNYLLNNTVSDEKETVDMVPVTPEWALHGP